MKRVNIDIADFNSAVFDDLNSNWMLLTAGTKEKFNFMTVSWGLLGTFWFRPVVMVGVRPQRYTFEFIEDNSTITLAAFPAEYKEQLFFCGRNSGRDYDKVAESGLTVIDSDKVEAPAFDEAELIIEARIVYTDSLRGKNFKDKKIIPKIYEARDFHKLYFAEVVNISGTEKYIKQRG